VSPILIAWMAGSAAEDFSESERPAIISEALSSLQKMLNRKIHRPEAAYFHDWQADPFFRGAYSYVPVNAMRAREVFSKPLEDSFFGVKPPRRKDTAVPSTVQSPPDTGPRANFFELSSFAPLRRLSSLAFGGCQTFLQSLHQIHHRCPARLWRGGEWRWLA